MKKLFMSLIISMGMTLVAPPVLVGAQTSPTPTPSSNSAKDNVCRGVGLTGGTTDCSNTGGPSVESIVPTVVNILSLIVGIISVIMIIIGGLKYITSAGDSNGVNSAKNTILYAVVGLVVVVLAQVIVKFVITRATTPPAEDKAIGVVSTPYIT